MTIKLFSITIQSHTILPANIHSYLVVCETLLCVCVCVCVCVNAESLLNLLVILVYSPVRDGN